MHLEAEQQPAGKSNAHLDIDNAMGPCRRTRERTNCTNTFQTIHARCSKDKNKGKACTILNTKGERGDKDRRGIKEKRSKVVVNRFSLERGIQGNPFFQPFERGVALPGEEDLTYCVQRNTNTEENSALERNCWWCDVHRRKKDGIG